MVVEWSLVSVVSLCLLAIIGFHCCCLHADQPPKGSEGFINIDCGLAQDTTITSHGLVYKSDKDMIKSGMSKQILAYDGNNNWDLQYWTLRSFPNGTRNCYHLEVDSAPRSQNNNSNTKYLIRGYFVYGNYDGLNFAPTFDLYLGPNLWARRRMNTTYIEAITLLYPSQDYFDVCFVNINSGVPYISSLELRPFNISLHGIPYPTHSQHLQILGRYNVGGTQMIKYPEDVNDRQWDTIDCSTFGYNTSLLSIDEAETDNNDDSNPYKLPQSMLRTACESTNLSIPLALQWTPSDQGSLRYYFYFCFHFAEIEKKLKAGQFREMSIVFNDVHTITNSIKLQLPYLKPLSFCSKESYEVLLNQPIKLSVSATSSSTLPPILNGIEIFYIRDASNPLTFFEDVKAMRKIKEEYKVSKNWEGDPCQPVEFSWEGLNCSNDHTWPRIISLNLSSSNLTGHIVSSISNLTAINTFNLSGNKLNGVLPDNLLNKYKNGSLVLSVEGNEELCWSQPCNHKKKKLPISIPILCSVIVAPILVLAILLGLKITYTRKSKEKSLESSHEGESLKMKNRHYSYLEVLSITDNFGVVIGEGGFGKVYLGTLKDKTQVAVKVLSPSSQQGYKQFRAEIQLLIVVHHCNLVTLLGYCDEGNHKALIYEYMPNGNLQQHLLDTNTNTLSWMQRLQIAVDAAHGLEYLHNGCKPPIIHRDLKPANILLDNTMHAKIADFGLSRTDDQSHFSTHFAGTPGYFDPRNQNVNKQSDVYSFGIILLELITGKPAIKRGSSSMFEGNFHILNWVESMIKNTGDIEKIVDSKLGGEFNQNSAWKIVELGMSCTQPTALKRPDMRHVFGELKECLAVHQNTTTTTETRIISTRVLSHSEIAPSPR
ncbi:probable LRR receptor-like serine/threonine-protein kinase At1g51880 isoform X2 [Benincasa hispida]|uniref:probable LRR receptor-like serine/threonine-protein kinase At1g51880 isoform X2 n=1 Tax=Benincasa hispida TaxID=102211 RepID=UPI0019013C04|nr:probable LRR receptor-like serine/threonine-protein kinase At1g51880 isoform X2 [Benincasa hispida]